MSSGAAIAPTRVERALRSTVALYVTVLVAVPLVLLVPVGLADGAAALLDRIDAPTTRAALWLTIWTALLVGLVNTVLGTATAWVLVRYPLPGRGLLSALVDLPLAIPTLVAGIMLAILYGPTSLVGEAASIVGLEIAFAPPGIVLALLFVTLPFVVRAVEPVLTELDPTEEEAAIVLGASPVRTFRTVILPAIAPAAVSGGIRSVGRALGEFGSIVIIAGNVPGETLTAPVLVFGEIESGAEQTAAAVSLCLLGLALTLHVAASLLERRMGARRAEH